MSQYLRYERLAVFVLFILVIAVGLVVFDDYGITYDESFQRNIGKLNLEYVTGKNDDLLSFRDRDYGPIYEMWLYGIERIILPEGGSSYAIYTLRHLLNHLFFILGGYILFRLLRLLFQNPALAWAGVITYFLTPRLYAHSFFNTKDIPFLVMSIITLYSLVLLIYRKENRFLVLHAVVCALATNFRIMGILLFALTLLLLSLEGFTAKERPARTLGKLAVFTGVFSVALVISWPYLWANPVPNFLDAFTEMSSFRQPRENLFAGNFVPPDQVPWHYVLTWFGLTTPPVYLLAMLAGMTLLMASAVPGHDILKTDPRQRILAAVLLFVVSPWLAVIVFDSVLYDGWRHLYFIYGGMIIIMMYLPHWLQNHTQKEKAPKLLSSIALAAIAIQWGFSLHTMVRMHPFQHVYFNRMIDHSATNVIVSRWDYDYWASSYMLAAKYLSDTYPAGTYNIVFNHPVPGIHNFEAFGNSNKHRFNVEFELSDMTDLVVIVYRGITPQAADNIYARHYRKIYTASVNNNDMLAIYEKIRPGQ